MEDDTAELIAGAALVGAVALLLSRRRGATSPSRSSSTAIAAPQWTPGLQQLGAPIDGPLRVTPMGYYGAPRFVTDGESSGRPQRPGASVDHYHQALDLQAKPGANVYAVGDGVIINANPGLGKAVLKLQLLPRGNWAPNSAPISHIVYADLGDRLVSPGQHVSRGQPIATVQARGFVHFSTKRTDASGEQFIDPARAGFVAQGRMLA